MKHRTYHAAQSIEREAHDGWYVAVGCSACGWTDWVRVDELTYVAALDAIYAARDVHEEDGTSNPRTVPE